MKKTIALMLCIVLAATLCACTIAQQSGTGENGIDTSAPAVSDVPEATVSSDPVAETTENLPEESIQISTETTVAPHVCSFGAWYISVPADCTNDGTETRECSCGITETRKLSATGHTETIVAAKSPDCLNSGLSEGKLCSVCGAVTVLGTEIPATGHNYQNGICTACGFAVINDVNHIHNYGEWIIETAATCTESGIQTHTCSCGTSESEPIAAIGHTETVIAGKAASCTEEGLTDGKMCSVCNTVLTEQSTIPAIGHDIIIVNTIAATCTAEGYTGDSYCNTCKTTISVGSAISILPHTEVIIPGKAADCTNSGLTNGKKCSVCDTITLKQTSIAPTGHNTSVINSKSATCTADGYTGDTYCSSCKTTVSSGSIIVKTGHNEIAVKGTAATCTSDGKTDGTKCSTCGTVIKKQTAIPATGHTNTTLKNKKEATCSATGYTGDTYCNNCKTTISKGKAIAKTAHTEIKVSGKKATCSATGLTEGKKCSVCGTVTVAQKTISKLAHTETVIPGKAPTCRERGLTDGKKCTVCGKTPVAQKRISATGHQNTEIVGYKDATTISSGYTGDKYCKDCGELVEYGRSIPIIPSELGIFRESIKIFHWDEESLYRGIESEIVRLTNIEREKAGLDPLIWVEDGYCFVKIRADESREFFSHTRPSGTPFYTAFSDYGVKYALAGENLYKVSYGGDSLPSYISDTEWASMSVDAWMNSEGHRKNILHPDYKYICVAISVEDGTMAAVQNFFGDTHSH